MLRAMGCAALTRRAQNGTLGLAWVVGLALLGQGCSAATNTPTVPEWTVSLRFAAPVTSNDSLEVVARNGRVAAIYQKARTVIVRTPEDWPHYGDIPGLETVEPLGVPTNPEVDIIAYPGRPVTAEDVQAMEQAGGRQAQIWSDTSVIAIFPLSRAAALKSTTASPRIGSVPE